MVLVQLFNCVHNSLGSFQVTVWRRYTSQMAKIKTKYNSYILLLKTITFGLSHCMQIGWLCCVYLSYQITAQPHIYKQRRINLIILLAKSITEGSNQLTRWTCSPSERRPFSFCRLFSFSCLPWTTAPVLILRSSREKRILQSMVTYSWLKKKKKH